MMWAAIVQNWIYERSECGDRAASPSCAAVDINVWVQTPSYILISLSEILASITGLELVLYPSLSLTCYSSSFAYITRGSFFLTRYAFALAPKNMRSLVTALFLFQLRFPPFFFY